MHFDLQATIVVRVVEYYELLAAVTKPELAETMEDTACV